MASFSWQRRQLLKALGASAAALPFYRLLESSVVHGQAAAPPMRLLLLYTGFGGRWEGLRPVGSNGRAEFAITPESLTFPNSSLEPLKKYSSKMMVLRGLATTAALLPNDPTRPLESRTLYLGHEHTCPTFFTGSAIRDVGGQCMPYSASLDYELGQHLGSGAAVRSIQLGIGCGSGNNHLDSLAFDRAGQRLPGFSNPADAYRQLFGNTVGGTGSTDAQRLKGQKSVLAAVQSSARRLRSRLATAEKVKLDDHLAALADIETRLGMTQYAPISCTSPTAPSLNRPGSGDTLPADTQIHFDLLTQAFACDRTRFVNAGWGNLGYGKLPWLFSDVDDMHGAVAHVTEDQTALGATARLRVAQLQNWYASRLCELMDRLNAVPESNGTLLDNTLIVWGQDFGEDIHGGLNVPYVLLGGAQGKLRMGRWLDFSPSSQDDRNNFRHYQPATKLWVSVLNKFGVQTNTFGSPEFPGPLSGL